MAATLKRPLLRKKELRALINAAGGTLDSVVKAGSFPPPIKLAPRTLRWIPEEVDAYIESLKAARGNTGGEA